MASDNRRAKILTRLATVTLPSIDGLGTKEDVNGNTVPAVYRNRGQLEGISYPAINMLDGGERRVTSVSGQSIVSLTAAVMRMTPQIFVLLEPRDTLTNETLAQQPAPVGDEIETWRVKVLNAMEADQSLLALCGSNGQIDYVGMDSDMETGQQMIGQILLFFAFNYVLNPRNL